MHVLLGGTEGWRSTLWEHGSGVCLALETHARMPVCAPVVSYIATGGKPVRAMVVAPPMVPCAMCCVHFGGLF